MRSLLFLVVLLVAACGRDANPESASVPPPPSPEAAPANGIQTLDHPGTLSELERAAQPPDGNPLFEGASTDRPAVPYDAATPVQLEVISENGYVNARGQAMIDLLERDMAYLAVQVQTADGHPVMGAKPEFEIRGRTRLSAIDASEATDDTGMVSFGLIGTAKGADTLTVRVGSARTELLINVISLESVGYAGLDRVPGALRWEDLMRARLRFDQERVRAEFPADVAARHGQTVKLVGFMMPLEAAEKQTHFLLTANPPSCFFHIPGGPAGAVEVRTTQGLASTWDPVILEGRFETANGSEAGVVYRLLDARVVKP